MERTALPLRQGRDPTLQKGAGEAAQLEGGLGVQPDLWRAGWGGPHRDLASPPSRVLAAETPSQQERLQAIAVSFLPPSSVDRGRAALAQPRALGTQSQGVARSPGNRCLLVPPHERKRKGALQASECGPYTAGS